MRLENWRPRDDDRISEFYWCIDQKSRYVGICFYHGDVNNEKYYRVHACYESVGA